jgi:AcrR family transcriptional regulator
MSSDDVPRRGRGRPRRVEADAEILDAARALLQSGGYGALSLDEVARRAGTAKSSIYRRWRSKAALAAEIVAHELPAIDDPARAFDALMNGPMAGWWRR